MKQKPEASNGLDPEQSLDLPTALGAVLVTARTLPGAPAWTAALPTNTLGLGFLTVFGAFRRARWPVQNPLLTFSAISLVFWLTFTTFFLNDLSEFRRAGNITLLIIAAAFIGSGRFDLRSLQRATLAGFVLAVGYSVVLHLSNPSASGYEGRLTGILGDPNAAGYIILAIGFSLAQGMQSKRNRTLLLVFMALTIWLTVSRTSMFAGLIGLSWVLVGRKVPRFISLAGLFFVNWFYGWANEYSDKQGWFVEREGSDNLRERLLIVEQAQVAEAGWTGNGLGTAVAELENITLFFHNSYLAMQAEGGLIALYLLYAVMAGLFLMFHKLPPEHRPVWAEAALITVAITSINIGFSITSPATAVAIGFFLYHHCSRREALKAEQSVPEHYRSLERT